MLINTKKGIDYNYTLWSLTQLQISVIPACPESFRQYSRRASLAGMTPENKLSNNGRPAVSAATYFTFVYFVPIEWLAQPY